MTPLPMVATLSAGRCGLRRWTHEVEPGAPSTPGRDEQRARRGLRLAMRGIVTDPQAPAGLRLADDLPEPAPGPGEVIVGVRAFSVNAGEVSLIEQRPDGWRPGQDTAGVVLRAAADGTGPPAGTPVVAYPEWHGWAERIAVPAGWVAALPEEVPPEQAATLPVAGLTALRALRAGGALLGRNVLITGATGGVGQCAVQLAVTSGARVTAQVGRPARKDEARLLGAHQAVVSLDELPPMRVRSTWSLTRSAAHSSRTADAFAAMARREFAGKAVLTIPA
jgi:NADPH:quinone reductase-like Zn-dependent oxidoreductase